jgi:chromosome segregation ATPase
MEVTEENEKKFNEYQEKKNMTITTANEVKFKFEPDNSKIEKEIELLENKIEKKIDDQVKRLKNSFKDKVDSLENKIQNNVENDFKTLKTFLEEDIKKRNKKEDEMLEWLKNIFSNTGKTLKELQNKVDEQSQKITELEKKMTETEGKNKQLLDSIELKEKKITKQEEEIDRYKNDIKNIQDEKTQLKRYFDSCKEKNSSLEEKLEDEKKNLFDYKKVFENEKLLNLLNSILANPALSTYRKYKKIEDHSPQSLFNLISKLATSKVFIGSYYDDLVNYKKNNHSEMSEEEIKFYKAVNDYFGEEVIDIPDSKRIEKFDKAKHIGMKENGKLTMDGSNNAIILIPADTTNNDKMKVAVK